MRFLKSRLIASVREIEFDSIPKVEIDNLIRFQKLNRKPNRKTESNRQDLVLV